MRCSSCRGVVFASTMFLRRYRTFASPSTCRLTLPEEDVSELRPREGVGTFRQQAALPTSSQRARRFSAVFTKKISAGTVIVRSSRAEKKRNSRHMHSPVPFRSRPSSLHSHCRARTRGGTDTSKYKLELYAHPSASRGAKCLQLSARSLLRVNKKRLSISVRPSGTWSRRSRRIAPGAYDVLCGCCSWFASRSRAT